MTWRAYLPSTQFAVMAGALFISGGLVMAAQYVAARHTVSSSLSQATTPDSSNTDWQSQLDAVAESSGVSAPVEVSQDQVTKLVQDVSSSNLTQTVAKSLLVNIAAAQAQGLGDDTPTEDQILQQASALTTASSSVQYSASDISVVPSTNDSLHAYGDAIMQTLAAYPNASSADVTWAIGGATDYQDASKLAPLAQDCPAFSLLANALVGVPVPQTLVSLTVEVINDFAAMGSACTDMQNVLTDPVRGLSGLQDFEDKGQDAADVFTSIAKNLNQGGILFTKDEPGAAWSAFLASP